MPPGLIRTAGAVTSWSRATNSQRGAILRWGALGVILAAGAAAYSNSFSDAFHLDDRGGIVENLTIRHLWPLSGPLRTPMGGATPSGRPLFNLTLAINYAISGEHLWSYHAFNLGIHLGVAGLLFGILWRTLEPLRPDDGLLIAFLAAGIWAVHPLQTESVTYVIQRAESLTGLFYAATLYGFIRRWWVFSVAMCLCGMACKEVMASAPIMILLYDRALVAGTVGEAWRRRKAYYLALGATWLLLAFDMYRAGSRGGTVGVGSHIVVGRYWATQFEAIAHYLRLVIWPDPLVFDYGAVWPASQWQVLPYVPVVAALVGATAWGLGKNRPWALLGAWMLMILAPTSLIPGNRQTLSEHRMYLPAAAELAAIVIALASVVRSRWLLLTLGLGAGTAAALATVDRNDTYASDFDLARDNVAKRPSNYYTRYYLGWLYELAHQPQSAVAEYREVLRQQPNFYPVYVSLGNVLFILNRPELAKAEYEKVLRLQPERADAKFGLGSVMLDLGDPAEAARYFAEVIKAEPNNERAKLAMELVNSPVDSVLHAKIEATVFMPGGEPADAGWKRVLDRTADPIQ